MPRARPGYRAALHLTEYFDLSGAGEMPEVLVPGAATFVPNLGKRPGRGPFDYAPILQGDRLVAAVDNDQLYYGRGGQLGNHVGHLHQTIDPYQGTVVFWFTPEWNGNDGLSHSFWYPMGTSNLVKTAANNLQFTWYNQIVAVSVAGWTEGTTYLVIARWDTKSTLDGTNHLSLTVNAADTFGATTRPIVTEPLSSARLGAYDGSHAAGRPDGIIEGFTVFRRPLYDGAYGVAPLDGADELAAIYAAGSGADPAQVVGGGGSWDIPLCIPTDSAIGILATGTDEAWAHPFTSELLDVAFMEDGDPPGTPYAVEFDGSSIDINCGSGATLDNLPQAVLTGQMWVRFDEQAANNILIDKGGWQGSGWVVYTSATHVIFKVDMATDSSASIAYTADGKWHHVAWYVDGAGAKTTYIALDGVWATGSAGAGAVVADAAYTLFVGRATSNYLHGAVAWWELWDNDHLGFGTDFVPPRAPTAAGPGNLVETWWADEGSGTTVAARVTTPGNDGTISADSWSRIWEQQSTPVIPQSIECDAATTTIDGGSGATIDNLPTGANGFTAEMWLCLPETGTMAAFMSKRFGWNFYFQTGVMRGYLNYDTTEAFVQGRDLRDGIWHHVAITYNENTDRLLRMWIDGKLAGTSGATAGAYIGDAAGTMYARDVGWMGTNNMIPLLGWMRLSDTVRYTNTFIPNARTNPPGIDGNTQLQWDMNDGAGSTVTDTSGNANHGTVTWGLGRWWTTMDMENAAPGERVYPWGYDFGVDAAAEGITIIEDAQVTAGKDYVVRAILSQGMSGRARPYLYVYDNIGAAQIGANFYFPRYVGQHDGGNNQASLTDTGTRWIQDFTGWTVYNVSDGSSATITSNTEQNVVGALAGGTDNDWDNNEWYFICPPSNRAYSQHPWVETFVFTAPAGCTSVDVRVLNGTDEGVTHVHQVEILESLLVNGNCETGAGVPWVPTGWNATYIAGEAIQELTNIHSGASAVEIVSAAALRFLYDTHTTTLGDYYCWGYWARSNGTDPLDISDANGARNVLHNDASSWTHLSTTDTEWHEIADVRRNILATPAIASRIRVSAAGSRYIDDFYAFELDDVTLTAIPASLAGSQEDGGIRVDGWDYLTTVPTRLTATTGWIRLTVVVRQTLATSDHFHQLHTIYLPRFDGNNMFHVQLRPDIGPTSIRLVCVANAVTVFSTVALPGGLTWNPGDIRTVDVRYTFPNMSLWVDGLYATSVVMPFPFAGDMIQVWWGGGWGDNQIDAAVY